jgi:hypothetical protein
MGQPQKEERAILQAIRRGTAPAAVKRQASRGVLPVSADELLEILLFLIRDPDLTCSQQAQQTLAGWTEERLARALGSNALAPETLTYFATQPTLPDSLRRIILVNPRADESVMAALVGGLGPPDIEKLAADEGQLTALPKLVAALLERQDLPAPLRDKLEEFYLQQAQQQVEEPAPAPAPTPAPAKPEAEPEDVRERLSVTQKISRMTVSERVQLALKGSKDERMVLIRDPSKVVYRAVLQSPKLGDSEVEGFASMKNIAEEALRIIANSRKFMKSYVVVRQLVNNPRTPIDVSLTLLNRLTEQDLRFLSRNRNIPETLRTMALKLCQQRARAR